jgi:hypothetical protein
VSPLDDINEVLCGCEAVPLAEKRPFRVLGRGPRVLRRNIGAIPLLPDCVKKVENGTSANSRKTRLIFNFGRRYMLLGYVGRPAAG